MYKTWIKNSEFTPLFLSTCKLNENYLKRKWINLNDISNTHISILIEEREEMISFVLSQLVKKYPTFKTLKNRDGNLVLDYLRKSAITGSLPSLTKSINEGVNYMLLSIYKEVMLNTSKWFSSFYEMALLFKDCQQVQYRAITEMYKKIKNMGSLEMRVLSIVDSYKYIWFRKLIDVHVGGEIDPHSENFYWIQFSEILGLDDSAAKSDKLANTSTSGKSIDKLRKILWEEIINIDDIFNDIYLIFHGKGITEEESILCSSELKVFLNNESMYSLDFYDIETGYITYDTTVKILLLLEVITNEKDYEKFLLKNEKDKIKVSNEKYMSKEKSGEKSSKNYKKDDNEESEEEYQYDEEDYGEENYGEGDDEDYEYEEDDNENYNTKKPATPEKVKEIEHSIELKDIPKYLYDPKDKYEKIYLILKCVNNKITYSLKSSDSNKIKYLLDIFTDALKAEISYVPSCSLLTGNYLEEIYNKTISKLYDYILYCPICETKHDITPRNVMCCKKPECLEQFIKKQLGKKIETAILDDAFYIDFLISITYWALAEDKRFPERRDLNFTPFPTSLVNKGVRAYEQLKVDLDNLPPVDVLYDMVESGIMKDYFQENVEMEEIYYVLQWILCSNRTQLKYIKPSKITEHERKLMGNYNIIFKIRNPPEVEYAFEKLREDNPEKKVEFVYHGSNSMFWHSVLRNNLQIYSNTRFQVVGSVYGAGVYFGSEQSVSASYVVQSTNGWNNSKIKLRSCMMICEFMNHNNTDSKGTVYPIPPSNFRIARETQYFIPRYMIGLK